MAGLRIREIGPDLTRSDAILFCGLCFARCAASRAGGRGGSKDWVRWNQYHSFFWVQRLQLLTASPLGFASTGGGGVLKRFACLIGVRFIVLAPRPPGDRALFTQIM